MEEPAVFFSASEKFTLPTYVCGSWTSTKFGRHALAIYNDHTILVTECSVKNEQQSSLPSLLRRMTELRHKNIVWPFAWHHFGHTRHVLERRALHVLEHNYVRLDPRTAPATSLHQIASGLLYLHDSGVVHGNLTLACLVTSADGQRVKIAGCGIACIQQAIASRSKVYDSMFRAPEQNDATLILPAADVYAFGQIVSCLARPFDAEHLTLPEPIRLLSVACTRRDVKERPTMKEIVDDMRSRPSDFNV